jgi:legumain
MRLILSLLAICLVLQPVLGDDWAVLVAGSNTWGNYRHQADICHAYQVVHANGIPDERIIMLYYDDIANAAYNPFPGKIYNKPTTGSGTDVYAGCKKDYTGKDVTAKNFLNIITGNAAAMVGIGSGKVLKSGPNDNVFINFSDHGGTGLICFPVGDYLYVQDLNNALQQMYQGKMFKKLVFYLEACESGSMFEGVLPTNEQIYVTTASNAEESSWGCYCPPDDVVNGKEMNSCLGDLYSVNWMENVDQVGPKETLQAQFTVVKNLTDMSHVMQYGDLSFTSDPVGNFMGQIGQIFTRGDEPTGPMNNPFYDRSDSQIITEERKKQAGVVESRDIPMHLAYYRYLRADKKDLTVAHALAEELLSELSGRLQADKFFMGLAALAGESNAHRVLTQAAPTPVTINDCSKAAFAAYEQHCGGFNDYSRQYTRVVVNLCSTREHFDNTANIVNHIVSQCQA